MKRALIICTFLIMISFGFSVNSSAGCISDCKSDYESEIQSCQIMWGSDPDDDFMYKNCIDDAKSTYESCEEECMS